MLPNKEIKSGVQPTLEDLLRLKRAERPDAAFWQDFERGMRQKQLAAIIEPRPWWLGLALLSRRIGPVGLPISAGAAAMLALVVMRVSPAGGLTQIVPASSPEPVAVAVAAPPAAVAPATKSAAVKGETFAARAEVAGNAAPAVSVTRAKAAPVLAERPPASAPVTSAATASVASEKAPVSLAKSAVPELSPKTSTGLATAEAIRVDVVAKSAPAAMAALVPAVASSDTVLDSGAETFGSLGAVIPSEDSLDAAVAGLNPRQARLLASATEVAEGKSLAPVRERVLHRLVDDEARYASISRLGVNADRLSLKF
jgi:hypothetical protein